MSQGYYAGKESAAGSVLASAREELNLSVADVARHLKLSPAQVEALEDGAYERLPGRVFVWGFLRNYAKLLGIDPQPLLRGIESQMPAAAIAEERPPSPQVFMPHGQPARWPLYVALAAVVIVGALAVYEFGFHEAPQPPESDSSSPGATPGSDAIAEAPSTARPSAPAVAPASPTPSVTPMSATAVPSASVSQTRPAQGQSGSAAIPTGDQSKSAVRTGGRELYFRFDQESWVEIRDRNDKVIFSKLNRAGSEERVSAAPPLKLVVGNARGVRLSYDDQAVDLAPHTGVTVARLTLE